MLRPGTGRPSRSHSRRHRSPSVLRSHARGRRRSLAPSARRNNPSGRVIGGRPSPCSATTRSCGLPADAAAESSWPRVSAST
eukprot:2590805-Prymnesium_polylepis.1